MKVLGIETSCDESAVCLIEGEGDFGPDFRFKVLGNALASQASIHAQYGGVFPNIAKREHAKALVPLLEHALHDAGMAAVRADSEPATSERIASLLSREPELWSALEPFLRNHAKPDIDCIAVTAGPGLEPALWVGVNFAKALSIAWDIPLVAVNHMEGHIVVSLMRHENEESRIKNREEGQIQDFEFPLLALLISGGHTELVVSRSFGEYEVVGRTRDDAAGEAFDKVARMLGLPYPGGPHISALAEESRMKNEESKLKLPRPMLHEDNYDFSFSGLKTAVRKLVEAVGGENISADQKRGIAREFEDAVADVLVEKTLRAVDAYGINTVVVGGGVSANTFIRARLGEALAREGGIAKLLVPPSELATDNALMIALAGYFHAAKKEFATIDSLRADGNLSL